MFCCLRFKFDFYQILWHFWGRLGLHLASFSRKKPVRNSIEKKGAPIWKLRTMDGSRGSQRGRLLLFFIKADASRARCLDNNNNKVKLNSIQIELRSGWGLAEVWLELEFLLELASIAKQIQNNSINWKGLRSMKMVNVKISKTHCWWSDTPTGPRPGEFLFGDTRTPKKIKKNLGTSLKTIIFGNLRLNNFEFFGTYPHSSIAT